MNTIKIRHGDNISFAEAEDGISLLEAVSRVKDLHIDASCGGKGTCGMCKVKILKGELQEPSPADTKFLGRKEIDDNYRLACMIPVNGNFDIMVNGINEGFKILTSHSGFTGKLNSIVKKKYIILPAPSLEDQRSDLSRLLASLTVSRIHVALPLRQSLPSILRYAEYSVTAVFSEDTLIAVEPGNTEDLNYGVAIDIGTTTIAAYLLNMETGEILDTLSDLNSQKVFGADVISRIEFSMQGQNKLSTLQEKIISQVGELSVSLSEKNGICTENIYSVVIAGNTTMIHLFFGVDPSGIAVAPFIPGFLGEISIYSGELKDFPLNCTVYSLPSISGYVGADIVSGILATKMDEREELSLLIDIGTNGEIVFGNKEKLYCCSTAAGPAFEGAHISCGLGGINGAVDSALIEDDQLIYTTIGGKKAVGICGSGIIDLVSVFLKEGLLDFTGRILDEEEVRDQFSTKFLNNLRIDNNGPAFLVVKASESGNGRDVVFTQQDIREVQLAKAAISAGILTVLNKAGRSLNEIDHVFIAGGFGSYISKKSAANIGLIPAELLDKTESVGNTAGLGALSCALSQENLNVAKKIAEITEYVELSSDSFFNMKYMEEMVFPEY
ncbi:MAG: ASKHA domain-containing protein [Spirochaetales bacterium]|nr:ASKHA domain-containing protein [Spirochaetales bacterium]